MQSTSTSVDTGISLSEIVPQKVCYLRGGNLNTLNDGHEIVFDMPLAKQPIVESDENTHINVESCDSAEQQQNGNFYQKLKVVNESHTNRMH